MLNDDELKREEGYLNRAIESNNSFYDTLEEPAGQDLLEISRKAYDDLISALISLDRMVHHRVPIDICNSDSFF